ncbi:MAG TPA: transmembrane 220 family protein [Candidatus Sphingobacterium stercoripullorum]|uniref:Transmembrane 220 family protein n=1 Tax=Candidatus Sphingobacterium stercoripullorum TaxID=2838759 RepID=A0A9D2AZL0_9SPHI|nr:transmembrane 220 family protein [Candidatus Sphingobacterium stercoripullorum]
MWLDIFNIFFTLSFIVFAYLNLNDDDSWLWVPIYLIPAALCGLAVFKIEFTWLYLIVIVVYGLYALKIFFTKDGVLEWIGKYNSPSLVQSMQATKPYIELAREFFGLLIVIAVMLINCFL